MVAKDEKIRVWDTFFLQQKNPLELPGYYYYDE